MDPNTSPEPNFLNPVSSQANAPLSQNQITPSPRFPVSATCPYCGSVIPAHSYFCIQCDKAIKSKPVSISIVSQIWLYFLSLCLPPLGLGLTIKYIKDDAAIAKKIGLISLLMTVVSFIFAVYLSVSLVQNINQLFQQQLDGGSIESRQVNELLNKYGIDSSVINEINQSTNGYER